MKKPKASVVINWQDIKDWKTVCKVNGISEKLPKLIEIPKEFRPRMIADYVLMQVTKALNGKWKVNYKDPNQYKYFPWFYVNASGAGFTGSFYGRWNASSNVGSRLCFESSEKALHSAKHFEKYHIDHQLN